MRAHEADLRREARSGVAERSAPLGADPRSLCGVGPRLVGLLEGSSELVLLDDTLQEVSRVQAPARPLACATLADNELAVIGASPELWLYRVESAHLELVRRTPLPGALSPRALVASARHVYIADQATDMLYVVARGAHARQWALPVCRRPTALALTARELVVNCLYEHALSVRPLDASGLPRAESARIENAGPFWGLAALRADGALWVAASGVEGRALERFDGAFGYVDSFAWLYRVRGKQREAVWAANLSEQNVLVPKGLVLTRASSHGFQLWLSSSGTDQLVRFDIDAKDGSAAVAPAPFVPGVTDLVRHQGQLYGASPLLDAWAKTSGEPHAAISIAPVSSNVDPGSVERRLGEAVVFTSIIAPHASSAGQKSRFTCETCHFEGGVDARVHHTGRGAVHVATRPLFGLLHNAPHFSRALDPDLASVSHNEFRVASLGNSESEWFTLRLAEFPWLSLLGVNHDVGPEALRRALLTFLARYEFPQNPRTKGRHSFSSLEARGAELFRERCEACHAARLASDEPASRVPFSGWQASLFELDGPVVWARGDYALTRVVPYVNERGTRIPSLRRIADKYPYFTNGSARSLDEVVARSARVGDYFSHDARSAAVSADDVRALVAFLKLL